MTTRICIIRHGETDWNAGRRIQGQIDVPLSAVGHAQARATANALRKEEIAALYSSDLVRARQTAEATVHIKRVPLTLEPGLRERHFGLLQGLTHAEAEARHPEEYRRHRTRDPAFAPPGGESLRDFAARLKVSCGAIAERHAGQTAVLFTHGGVLDLIYRWATGRPLDAPRDFSIPNCGINWFAAEGERWTLLSWAERDHLEGARDEL